MKNDMTTFKIPANDNRAECLIAVSSDDRWTISASPSTSASNSVALKLPSLIIVRMPWHALQDFAS